MKPIQLIAGVAAGVVGATLWAAIAYFAHLEIGYIAWAIGLAVGIAVAATGHSGTTPGVAAVLITIVALLAGKFAAVTCEIQNLVAADSLVDSIEITNDNLQDHLAEQIVAEREATDQMVITQVSYEGASFARKYPKEVWQQAGEQLNAMPNEQKEALRAQQKAKLVAEIHGTYEHQIRENGFLSSFGIFDLVFFGLAIATAWGVATREEA